MKSKPALTLYVTTDCPACRRTEEVLRACEEITSLVDLRLVLIGANGQSTPASVVGAPTIMFNGAVVGLGTPDCGELARKLRASLSADAVS